MMYPNVRINKFTSSKYFVVICSIVLFLIPILVSNLYYVHVFNIIGIYIMLALSLDLLLGTVGLMQLGHAGFYGFGAYFGAILSTKVFMESDLGFWLGLPIVLIATMFIGFLVGAPSLRLKGIYFALLTLGFGEIMRSILLNFTELTNGPFGIKAIPSPEVFGVSLSNQRLSYYLILSFVILFNVVINALRKSKYGRYWRAIREDEIVASTTGINTFNYKIIALMISAGMAGVTGSIFAHYVSYINPSNFIMDESILILTMVMVGGRDKLLGAIVGAASLIILPEVLRFMSSYRLLIYGIGLIGMIIFKPEGLMGDKNGK